MALKQSKYLLLLICFVYMLSGFGQEPEYILDDPDEEFVESPFIDTQMYFLPGEQHDYNNRELDSDIDSSHWKKLVSKLDFREAVDSNKNKEKKSKEKPVSNSEIPFSKLFKYLWLLPALFILILLLVRIWPLLFQNNIKNKQKNIFKTEDLDEDEMRELEIESALDEALRLENYRLAYRLRYLDVLKQLIDRNLIFYKKEKTNYEYLLQLQSKSVYEPFRLLTLNFDGIWYGDLEIDKVLYDRLDVYFLDFKKALDVE